MEPFKNEFSYQKARRTAECLARTHPDFSVTRFCRGLEKALEPLELKNRMHLLASRIETGLPQDPPEMFSILVKTLATDEDDSTGLRGFSVWPLTEIVARRGLCHFDDAMAALSEMTSRFSAEFAIRPFLRIHPERTLAQLLTWCAHPDEHVRRLVSEGSRPLLPWGGNLSEFLADPHPTVSLLDKLHADPSSYVRLSVSNHLNDLSKSEPALVVRTLTRWRKRLPGDKSQEKLARHACRTLLKDGHPGALKFHGYGPASSFELVKAELTEATVVLGEFLQYRLSIRNNSARKQRLLFDYAIHHRKANGTLTPKVFKGRIRELAAGELWEITGRHPVKPVTTRVYHPGLHAFEPRLNGRVFPQLSFTLEL